MTELVLTRGVPASGKSTWAREWVAQDENRVRINRDDIRYMLYGKYWGVDEHAVTVAQDAVLAGYIAKGRDIVLDNTNLKARDVKSVAAPAIKAGYTVSFQDFPVSYADALMRDAFRGSKGERYVGYQVLDTFFSRYIKNRETGALPPVPVIDPENVKSFAPYVYDPMVSSCILIDIDGTLAHMTDRGPYDTSRYHTDSFDRTVADIARYYTAGAFADLTMVTTIVMSGRSEDFRGVTEDWLLDNGFDYDLLYMRPSGDTRNDAIVKDELFEKHIAGFYNVDFILDDRDRVVQMWRAKGLKVLQVADGAF